MTVLAIETATTVCATAVVRDGSILSEASLNEKYVHAEKLMTLVDSVLTQTGVVLDQVDGIAISIGPGSFTGLRIGLSVAKGLSFAVGKKLVRVPTLHALAQRAVDEAVVSEGEFILAALDARRDEVYCEFFSVSDGQLHSLAEPLDMLVSNVAGAAPEGRIWVTGDARSKFLPVLNDAHSHWSFVPEGISCCRAGTVGLLGEGLMMKGETTDVATLEPYYIKEFFFRQRK
jgi:tRNA threonylcarbamoyladenosine biosynthesis protein TsaB